MVTRVRGGRGRRTCSSPPPERSSGSRGPGMGRSTPSRAPTTPPRPGCSGAGRWPGPGFVRSRGSGAPVRRVSGLSARRSSGAAPAHVVISARRLQRAGRGRHLRQKVPAQGAVEESLPMTPRGHACATQYPSDATSTSTSRMPLPLIQTATRPPVKSRPHASAGGPPAGGRSSR